MDSRELTELIKTIALEEIQKSKGLKSVPSQKVLILVPPSIFAFGKFFDYVREHFGDYQVHIASCHVQDRFAPYQDSGVRYLDVTDLKTRQELFDHIEDYEKACVLISDLTAMEDLLEIRSTTLSQMVNYLIMQDMPIEALWAYKRENRRMKDIRNSQKKLECLGISSTNICKEKVEKRSVHRVITERDVFDAHHQNVKIIKSNGQLVTPLAKDRARELKIAIQ